MLLIFLFIAIVLLLLAALAALAWFGSNYLLARREPDEADSPAHYGLAAEAAEFLSGDGLMLRGWYIPCENSARTIVVCSGANGSLDADLHVAPWLHDAGFNVLLFNWRAHGQSDGRAVTLGFNERYDLIAAVQFVKAKGAESVGALGFSMGGTVAIATAAVYEDIDAVAADSPFVYILSAVAGGLIERGAPEGLSYALARLFVGTACLRMRLNLFDIDLVRWIHRLAPRPLLLIFGEQDVIVPKSEIDRLCVRAGESKEVWRVPGVGHRRIEQSQPEAYRQRITQFFSAHL
jgi:alpha-beta hydrolase superfamily lysophospholipase